MSSIEPAAQAAILDGGLPGLIALGGGSLRVALFRLGVECSGNGYARQTITSSSAASAGSGLVPSAKNAATVTFTPSGGSITYDQVRVFAANGTTLYSTSDRGSALVINEPAVMTISYQIPQSPALPAYTAEEVQDALTNDITTRQPCILGGARIPVASQLSMTGTLTTDGAIGGAIIGLGATERVASTLDRLRSTVYWTGDRGALDTEALLRITRSDVQLRGVSFDGATDAEILAEVVNRGPCAIELDRATTGASVGSGKFKFDDVSFCYWRTGLRLANALADGNCDESEYRNLFFDRCDVAVELNGSQTMEHHFRAPRFRLTDECIRLNAGGAVSLHGGNMTHPGTVIKYAATNAQTGFGQNNASITIGGRFKLDSQSTGGKVIDMEQIASWGYFAQVNAYDVHLPSPAVNGFDRPYWSTDNGTDINDIDPIVFLSGNANINLYGWRNLQRGMFAWYAGAGGSITVNVIGGQWWSGNGGTALSAIEQLCNTAKSHGTAYFNFYKIASYATATPLADFSGTITGAL